MKDLPNLLEIDFLQGAIAYRVRQGKLRTELLAKAIGIKGDFKPSVIDATAGLGRDAFILACLGCHVVMLERSTEIAALLSTALQRLATTDLKLNLSLINIDAKEYLSNLSTDNQPDVVYLDPMYPERKKSALVKKEMRLLKEIVGEDEDAPTLLEIALRRARKRVVVKRPRLAVPLGGKEPDFAIKGKTQRFDVYLR